MFSLRLVPNDRTTTWHLPRVTKLIWEQFLTNSRDEIFKLASILSSSITEFLSRCSFPSLLAAELKVASAHGTRGTSHLKLFLENHPQIKRAILLLLPQQYRDIVPCIKTFILDLTQFASLTGDIVDLLPASVVSVIIGIDPHMPDNLI
jgi:hypothetical protein